MGMHQVCFFLVILPWHRHCCRIHSGVIAESRRCSFQSSARNEFAAFHYSNIGTKNARNFKTHERNRRRFRSFEILSHRNGNGIESNFGNIEGDREWIDGTEEEHHCHDHVHGGHPGRTFGDWLPGAIGTHHIQDGNGQMQRRQICRSRWKIYDNGEKTNDRNRKTKFWNVEKGLFLPWFIRRKKYANFSFLRVFLSSAKIRAKRHPMNSSDILPNFSPNSPSANTFFGKFAKKRNDKNAQLSPKHSLPNGAEEGDGVVGREVIMPKMPVIGTLKDSSMPSNRGISSPKI